MDCDHKTSIQIYENGNFAIHQCTWDCQQRFGAITEAGITRYVDVNEVPTDQALAALGAEPLPGMEVFFDEI